MPEIVIRVEGTGGAFGEVFQNRRLIEIPDSIPIRIETLDVGMASGQPSVAFILELPKERTVVLAQTSVRLFQLAAAAVRGKYGDCTAGAFTARQADGALRMISSEEIACPHCGLDVPSHCKFCFDCGGKLHTDGSAGAGKTQALPPVPVAVTKKSDDPDGVIRVSVGGGLVGYYCTYRGTRQEAIRALRSALRSMNAMQSEPPVSPDDGKRYA